MTPWTTITLDLTDETATVELARRLAEAAQPGDVYALEGDLGSGKTTLARAFIRTLTHPEEEVPSPTFTLVQLYDTSRGCLWHFDLYRLERPDDVLELGIDDAFADGISLIEWPDRLGPWLPAERLVVALSAEGGPTGRQVRLAGGKGWCRRLAELFHV